MSTGPGAAVTLWRRGDFAVLSGAFAAGLLLVAIGYWGVSGTRVVSDQMGALWIASGGVVVSAGGITTLIVSGRRRILQRRRALLPDAADILLDTPAAGRTPEPVAGAGMTRYHRPGCPFVAGKAAVAAPAVEHDRAGRRPCGVCRP